MSKGKTITLTKRQKQMYDAIGTEWKNFNLMPSNVFLAQLEKRGLIEFRVDPAIAQRTALDMIAMGEPGVWQVRRVPPLLMVEGKVLLDDPINVVAWGVL